jgi:hypothetical protein
MMGALRRLFGERWLHADQARTRRQLMSDYFSVLRRARVVGWGEAKAEYVSRGRSCSRSKKDIGDDLATFDELNESAWSQGIDPIRAQRRRDLYAYLVTPIAIMGGVIITGMGALQGVNVFTAVGTGFLTVLLGRHAGALLALVIAK